MSLVCGPKVTPSTLVPLGAKSQRSSLAWLILKLTWSWGELALFWLVSLSAQTRRKPPAGPRYPGGIVNCVLLVKLSVSVYPDKSTGVGPELWSSNQSSYLPSAGSNTVRVLEAIHSLMVTGTAGQALLLAAPGVALKKTRRLAGEASGKAP